MDKKLLRKISFIALLLVGALATTFPWLNLRQEKPLSKIIHTSGQPLIHPLYIEEMLGLSVENPKMANEATRKELEKKLLAAPWIASGEVKIVAPGVIEVCYQLSLPLFQLEGFKNLAIDKMGHSFPLNPLFAGQKMPLLRLPLAPSQIEPTTLLKIVSTLLELEKLLPSKVFRFDLTRYFLLNGDLREIVVSLKGEKGDHHLRLSAKDPQKSIAHYLEACKSEKTGHLFVSKELMVDLRFEDFSLVIVLE